MGRHAYLIMCHNNFNILEKLVSLLDDPLNDIYIHVDRKVGDITNLKKRIEVKASTITYIKRISVSWGGFSQIKAEMLLLKAATQEEHDYYHLLSGVDMPLKSQTLIREFFQTNQGKEFIDFDPITDPDEHRLRIQYYRFFQDFVGRRTDFFSSLLRKLEAVSLNVQCRLGIDRQIGSAQLTRKGSQWFSITHGLATYLLQNEKAITKTYRFGLGVDELFLQTFSMTSPFVNNIADSAMRCIDWRRGSPYTFRSEDYELLITSEKLFARKFDENVDMEIVDRIYSHINYKNHENNT